MAPVTKSTKTKREMVIDFLTGWRDFAITPLFDRVDKGITALSKERRSFLMGGIVEPDNHLMGATLLALSGNNRNYGAMCREVKITGRAMTSGLLFIGLNQGLQKYWMLGSELTDYINENKVPCFYMEYPGKRIIPDIVFQLGDISTKDLRTRLSAMWEDRVQAYAANIIDRNLQNPREIHMISVCMKRLSGKKPSGELVASTTQIERAFSLMALELKKHAEALGPDAEQALQRVLTLACAGRTETPKPPV